MELDTCLKLAAVSVLLAASPLVTSEAADPFNIPEPDNSPAHSVFVGGGVSGIDSSQWQLGSSIGITDRWRTNISYGETRTRLDAQTLESDNLATSLQYEYGNWLFGANYESEDSYRQLEISSTGILLGYIYKGLSVTASPVSRDIRLYTNFVLPRRGSDYFDIESNGYRIDASQETGKRSRLDAGYESYDYDTDVSRLASSRLAVIILKPASLNRASGFIDKFRYLAGTLYLGSLELGLETAHTTSAIDGKTSKQHSIISRMPLGSNWALSLTFSTIDDGQERQAGAGTRLEYNW